LKRPIDLLVVGSGPVGSSYARFIAEQRPETSIMMVDVGPKLTDPPGVHVTAISDEEQLVRICRGSQGPLSDVSQTLEAWIDGGWREGEPMTTNPGLHLLRGGGLPAAAMASAIGGMGAYWTGVTPRPVDGEQVSFIAENEWELALREAERVLSVLRRALPSTALTEAVTSRLGEVFSPLLPAGREVECLPLAGRVDSKGRRFVTGPADILAPIARILSGKGRFVLRPDALCRSLTLVGERVSGAVIEHRPSGNRETIAARAVVVAADSFRTPQLLWASGIRPDALGRHLMDHPRSNAFVQLDSELSALLNDEHVGAVSRLLGAWGVPFVGSEHPFHGQIFAMAGPGRTEEHGMVAHGYWMGRTWPRPENRIVFSDAETDWCGMPAMRIEYALSREEESEIAWGQRLLDAAAASLGCYVPGREPRLAPLGWSLHYQGTVRMGERDDGTCVCSPRSRVWGVENLFLASNGVIPTATSCNPTLMTVALAAHSAVELLDVLG